jgi:hypothetical protein
VLDQVDELVWTVLFRDLGGLTNADQVPFEQPEQGLAQPIRRPRP